MNELCSVGRMSPFKSFKLRMILSDCSTNEQLEAEGDEVAWASQLGAVVLGLELAHLWLILFCANPLHSSVVR